MEKVGHVIKRMLNEMQMTDISSKAGLKWEYTRDEENINGVKVKNKLDVVAVSSNLITQCRARVTHIGDPTGISDATTDHKLLIARHKANNLIKAKSSDALERYKTRRFLESKPRKLRMDAAATNTAVGKIREIREKDATAQ